MKRAPVIAIDGPVASGKSTIAQLLARKLGYFYLDTGLLYRALTWRALQQRVDLASGAELAKLAEGLNVNIKPPTLKDGRQNDVYVEGRDVTQALRSPDVEAAVSNVAAHPEVRAALVD